MNLETQNKIEPLEVNFIGVKYGLLNFNVKIGNQSLDTRFSDAFDPVMNFRHWLEAIAVGVQQTSFVFDTEGRDIKFHFEGFYEGNEVFTAYEQYIDPEKFCFIHALVDRKQLVHEFYMSLLKFSKTESFRNTAWEGLYGATLKHFRSSIIEEYLSNNPSR